MSKRSSRQGERNRGVYAGAHRKAYEQHGTGMGERILGGKNHEGWGLWEWQTTEDHSNLRKKIRGKGRKSTGGRPEVVKRRGEGDKNLRPYTTPIRPTAGSSRGGQKGGQTRKNRKQSHERKKAKTCYCVTGREIYEGGEMNEPKQQGLGGHNAREGREN